MLPNLQKQRPLWLATLVIMNSAYLSFYTAAETQKNKTWHNFVHTSKWKVTFFLFKNLYNFFHIWIEEVLLPFHKLDTWYNFVHIYANRSCPPSFSSGGPSFQWSINPFSIYSPSVSKNTPIVVGRQQAICHKMMALSFCSCTAEYLIISSLVCWVTVEECVSLLWHCESTQRPKLKTEAGVLLALLCSVTDSWVVPSCSPVRI